MSYNETLNTWNSDNLVGEELTDAELADVQGGSYVVNFGLYAPYVNQTQVQVAAYNYGYVTQVANQSA